MKCYICICLFFILNTNIYAQRNSWIWLDNRKVGDEGLIKDLLQIHYSGEVNERDITSHETLSEQGILFVSGEINEDLPEVIYKSYMIAISGAKAFMFELSFGQVLEKKSPDAYLIGGIYQYRGIGYYHIFLLEDGLCRLIFKSDVPVFNTLLGCESFKGGKLELSYKDINNDQAKDLIFSGIKCNYCVKDQSDRIDDRVISEEKIVYTYLFDQKSKQFIKIEE